MFALPSVGALLTMSEASTLQWHRCLLTILIIAPNSSWTILFKSFVAHYLTARIRLSTSLYVCCRITVFRLLQYSSHHNGRPQVVKSWSIYTGCAPEGNQICQISLPERFTRAWWALFDSVPIIRVCLHIRVIASSRTEYSMRSADLSLPLTNLIGNGYSTSRMSKTHKKNLSTQPHPGDRVLSVSIGLPQLSRSPVPIIGPECLNVFWSNYMTFRVSYTPYGTLFNKHKYAVSLQWKSLKLREGS